MTEYLQVFCFSSLRTCYHIQHFMCYDLKVFWKKQERDFFCLYYRILKTAVLLRQLILKLQKNEKPLKKKQRSLRTAKEENSPFFNAYFASDSADLQHYATKLGHYKLKLAFLKSNFKIQELSKNSGGNKLYIESSSPLLLRMVMLMSQMITQGKHCPSQKLLSKFKNVKGIKTKRPILHTKLIQIWLQVIKRSKAVHDSSDLLLQQTLSLEKSCD